jgi:hypothetical protein
VVAAGEWSKHVTDTRGRAVRGRLVLCAQAFDETRREFSVFIELADVSEAIHQESALLFFDLGKHDFRPEYKSGLICELRDAKAAAVESQPFAFSGAVPRSTWVSLPHQSTIRLRQSPYGIHRPGATAICPLLGQFWVIADDDPEPYFLSGTFTIDPTEEQVKAAELKPGQDWEIWRGTLDLPPLEILSPLAGKRRG